MGETTNISWCKHTFNPWIGCQEVSPACDGCYARQLMDTRLGRVNWGPLQDRSRTSPTYWRNLIKWNKAALADGTRPFVFGGSLCDPFDNYVPVQWRQDYFDLIWQVPQLVMLLLTKRPQNIVKMVDQVGGLPPNVALGTTVEDNERLSNIIHLLTCGLTPKFFFVSCEPLLEEIDLTRISLGSAKATGGELAGFDINFNFNALTGAPETGIPKLGWVITGGETSQGTHKARPTHPSAFLSLRDQCAAAGVPFHHKQNGEWIPLDLQGQRGIPTDFGNYCRIDGNGNRVSTGWPMERVGKKRAGRLLDGVEHNEFPQVPA